FKGNVLFVVHTALGPYVLKSNALTGMTIAKVSGQQYYYTSITGKATWAVPTGDTNPPCGAGILKCGNFSFTMYAEDRKEPGANATTFRIISRDPTNALVLDTGATPITIRGGNVVVPP